MFIFGKRRAAFDGGNFRFAGDGKNHHVHAGVAEDFQQRPGSPRVAAHHDERARAEFFATAPASRRVPAPKMIFVAVVNSKRISITDRIYRMDKSPAVVSRIQIVELHARARLGHHRGDGVAPREVVRLLFVRVGAIRPAINFDEHKPRRVVRLLDDIESQDAQFQQT